MAHLQDTPSQNCFRFHTSWLPSQQPKLLVQWIFQHRHTSREEFLITMHLRYFSLYEWLINLVVTLLSRQFRYKTQNSISSTNTKGVTSLMWATENWAFSFCCPEYPSLLCIDFCCNQPLQELWVSNYTVHNGTFLAFAHSGTRSHAVTNSFCVAQDHQGSRIDNDSDPSLFALEKVICVVEAVASLVWLNEHTHALHRHRKHEQHPQHRRRADHSL